MLSNMTLSANDSEDDLSDIDSKPQRNEELPLPLEFDSSFSEDSDSDVDDNERVQKTSKPYSGQISHELILEKFNNYNVQIDKISEKAIWLCSSKSFFNCGFYQIISFLFISLAWGAGQGWYAYISVFTGYTPEFECDINSMENVTRNPLDPKCSAVSLRTKQAIKCSKWIYDRSQLRSTIVSEFDLVCDRNYYFELAYSIEQIGYVLGTLIFSYLADIIGRKAVFSGVIIGMAALGIAQYFVKDFLYYFIFGFFINSLSCGLEAVCITLILEMFSKDKRTFFGIGCEVVYILALVGMSPMAYVVNTWREIRLVIFIILSIMGLLSFWLVQESVRWLISIEDLDRAEKVVSRLLSYNGIAKKSQNNKSEKFDRNRKRLGQLFDELNYYNKTQRCDEVLDKNKKTDAKQRSKDTICDLMRNSKFRTYVLIMALNWFATSIVYDGLQYLNSFIGENIFINWIVMNMIELPAQVICYLVISRYGRRYTVSITLLLTGLILFATCLKQLPYFQEYLTWYKFTLFVLAKFVVTQSFSAIILQSPELYPTNFRSFGYGISLFSGKLTTLISPMISFYLGKIQPDMPAVIYGIISIICGVISLYIPETLNRPLPNSVSEVVKWPRSLTREEKKAVKELNGWKSIKQKLCCSAKSRKRKVIE